MSREFEKRYEFLKGLVPSDKAPYNIGGFSECANIVVKSEGFVPFNPSVITSPDCQVFQSLRHVWIIAGSQLEVRTCDDFEIVFTGTVLAGTWSFLDFSSFELLCSEEMTVYYDSENSAFFIDNLAGFPPIKSAINWNSQVYGCIDNKVVISKVNEIDFTIGGDNVAGEIVYESVVKAVQGNQTCIYVFTERGIFQLTPTTNGYTQTFFDQRIIANTKTVWNDSTHICFITTEGELCVITPNQTIQSFGMKYLFHTGQEFIRGFYNPHDNLFIINTKNSSYIFTLNGLSNTTHLLHGACMFDDEVKYFGELHDLNFRLLSYWFDFGQGSMNLVRQCEVLGNIRKPHEIHGSLNLLYHRGKTVLKSNSMILTPFCVFTPIATASHFQFLLEGSIDSFDSLHELILRRQNNDNRFIRGTTNVG